MKPTLRFVVVTLTAIMLPGCGDKAPIKDATLYVHGQREVVVDEAGKVTSSMSPKILDRVARLAKAQPSGVPVSAITVDYPLSGSLFPPEFISPTFLWHDETSGASSWLVSIRFQQSEGNAIQILVPGGGPPEEEIDMDAISDTNTPYEGTDYQRSAKAWTPSSGLWAEIKRRSLERNAEVTFTGFHSDQSEIVLSKGCVVIRTSKDPVGAPFFYRDVPLMPDVGEHGKIKPLGDKAIPIISWRLRDVSKPDSKLVLKGMHSCGNCHSFSADGGILGMDMDGPDGDKGMYAVKPVEKNMIIEQSDVITWNSFPDKPEGHRTLGLFSSVSPDGRFVASTVNEEIFIANFRNYKILQVFYPTRGIIGIYSRAEKKFFKLPGADDQQFVQTSPTWSPDGKWVYFSRAKAFDPYQPGMKMPEVPNDPNEPQIKYDIYRLPFNGGKGGPAEPVEGASRNGFSNTFPKVSPDNKWLVWTRCKNGMLLRPDGKLFIVPAGGGTPREMTCNTPLMNSWHSFSPNSRWMVFSSKARTPYTQAFLTHIDEAGNDSPSILVPNCTAANRAVNLPEFINIAYSDLDTIEAPVVAHHRYMIEAERNLKEGKYEAAVAALSQALKKEPTLVRALVNMGLALSRLGHNEEALLYTEKALGVFPDDLHALFNSSILYLKTDRPYMAEKALKKLVKAAPDFPYTAAAQAHVEEAVVILNSEIDKTEKALSADAESARLNHYLAELYRQAGRLERSLELMEKAYELSNGDPVVTSNLAWIMATNPDNSIRNGERAVKLAEKVVEETGGKRPEPLDVLAAAYAEVGETAKAIETSRRAVELARTVNPNMAASLEYRSKLFLEGQPIRMPRDR